MIRLIGIGSAFNDDDIGWRCLQNLQPQLQQLGTAIETVYCASPGTQLIHQLDASCFTILVDALDSDTDVGKVRPVRIDELRCDVPLSSHGMSVAHVLQLAENLDRLPEQIHILGMGIDPHGRLSAEQRNHLQSQLMVHIRELVEGHRRA